MSDKPEKIERDHVRLLRELVADNYKDTRTMSGIVNSVVADFEKETGFGTGFYLRRDYDGIKELVYLTRLMIGEYLVHESLSDINW